MLGNCLTEKINVILNERISFYYSQTMSSQATYENCLIKSHYGQHNCFFELFFAGESIRRMFLLLNAFHCCLFFFSDKECIKKLHQQIHNLNKTTENLKEEISLYDRLQQQLNQTSTRSHNKSDSPGMVLVILSISNLSVLFRFIWKMKKALCNVLQYVEIHDETIS